MNEVIKSEVRNKISKKSEVNDRGTKHLQNGHLK